MLTLRCFVVIVVYTHLKPHSTNLVSVISFQTSDPPKYSQQVLPNYISMWKFAFFCSSNNAKDLSIAQQFYGPVQS